MTPSYRVGDGAKTDLNCGQRAFISQSIDVRAHTLSRKSSRELRIAFERGLKRLMASQSSSAIRSSCRFTFDGYRSKGLAVNVPGSWGQERGDAGRR
jgi:hypothetical protein